jgi:uncharacterized surface protein with fasciclin (FAS1) repeats
VVGGCSSSGGTKAAPSHPGQRDLADILARQPELSILQQWITAADYTARLRRRGPYTLFAPNDNALDVIRPGQKMRLMRPESRDLLRAVLDHHLVAGRVSLGELRPRTTLRTIDGGEVQIMGRGRSVRFGTGNLVQPDIEASNGIIHVIDQVQLPQHLPEGPG